MYHHHDFRTGGKCLAIAGLLVSTVAIVAIMDESLNAELLSKRRRVVAAGIIDQNLDVDGFGQFADRPFERFCGVIRWHDHCDPFAVNHSRSYVVPTCGLSFERNPCSKANGCNPL